MSKIGLSRGTHGPGQSDLNDLPEGDWYDAEPTATYLNRIVARIIDDFSRREELPALRIVDLGCGNGSTAADLAASGHEVIGIDRSTTGIEFARARESTARFERCDLHDDRVFEIAGEADCVIAREVIEHLVRPRRVFEIAGRVLRPAGLLVITTPYHGYIKNLALSLVGGWDRHFQVSSDWGHVKFFSRKSLAALAAEFGFRDLAFSGAGRVAPLWKSIVMTGRRGTS